VAEVLQLQGCGGAERRMQPHDLPLQRPILYGLRIALEDMQLPVV
jgi:hypothetical protein